MSKISSNYPAYSSSEVNFGNSKATTGVKNGVLTADYNMSGDESGIYNYALSTIANLLPQLNTFDSNTQNSIQSQVNAYKDSAMAGINDIYNPLITKLENDITSRFGNLDNSLFTNNLNSIESERAKAISSFAQDILAKQSSLESDELTKRYALVEFLNGIANNTYDNALKAISAALGGSASQNNYNNDLYNAISAIQKTNSSSNNSSSPLLSILLGLTGNTGSSIGSILSL